MFSILTQFWIEYQAWFFIWFFRETEWWYTIIKINFDNEKCNVSFSQNKTSHKIIYVQLTWAFKIHAFERKSIILLIVCPCISIEWIYILKWLICLLDSLFDTNNMLNHQKFCKIILYFRKVRFWPNFKCRFQGPLWTYSNCHIDICPGNICSCNICPYNKLLSCYWPNLDQTLKVGSWDHLKQILTIKVTFFRSTFALATFVNIRNI